MNPRSFHSYACTYRINTIIIRFNSHLSSFSRLTYIFFIVINPSNTSGTSCSNNLSRNKEEVRDKMIRGFPFTISTRKTTARTVSPFLKKSEGICSFLGRINSLPSSSITSVSFFQNLVNFPC